MPMRCCAPSGHSSTATAPDMVLEEYIADTAPCLGEGFANYLSVESVVSAGVVEHFAVTGRFPLAPPFRETGFFIPADLTPTQRAAALDVASAAVRAVGVETGCLHTEIKFTPDGPRVIEVNGRLGGGVPLILEMATGASAPRLAMEVALGPSCGLCAPGSAPAALGSGSCSTRHSRRARSWPWKVWNESTDCRARNRPRCTARREPISTGAPAPTTTSTRFWVLRTITTSSAMSPGSPRRPCASGSSWHHRLWAPSAEGQPVNPGAGAGRHSGQADAAPSCSNPSSSSTPSTTRGPGREKCALASTAKI